MKIIVIIGAAALLWFLLKKKETPSGVEGRPMVPTVDYGGFGGFDFGGT